MKNLNRLAKMIGKWDHKMFGNHALSKAKHLRKEVDELIEALEQNNPSVIRYEIADVFILLSGIVYELNIDLSWYVVSKMRMNKKRKWNKPDKDGVIEHIKE